MTNDDWERGEMVRRQIERRGVRDPRVLGAMGRVPREAFLDVGLRHRAYEDGALPIAHGQTISQPYVVAAMIEALELPPHARVLEVGTGSGYAAAVLAEIADAVYTVERIAGLARDAERRLAALGYAKVHVLCADGTRGWPEHAPYHGILVSAGAPEVPPALKEQLAAAGRLVIPVGRSLHDQRIVRVRKTEDGGSQEDSLGAVRFVPLIGDQGWPSSA